MRRKENYERNIVKMMQKVAEDEELQAKMQAFTDADEAYEFARSIQDGFTKEEFVTTMEELREKISDSGELTDDDLAAAAGGMSTASISVVASVAGTVAIGIAFAV